jgi:Zn-dependent protease with chaperone function
MKNNNQKQNILEESLSFTFVITITSIFIFLITVFSYIFESFKFRKELRSKKELTEYSKELSKIVQEDITCYLIKSKVPNAFNCGGNECYITTKLYDVLNRREIIAILLHEYGHYKEGYSYKLVGFNLTIGILVNAILTTTIFLLTSFPIAPILLSMIFGSKIARWYSRKQEFYADKTAAQYGYSKELISGLKKIEVWMKKDVCKKLSKDKCDEYFEKLQEDSSHPAFKDRYDRIFSLPSVAKAVTYFSAQVNKSDELTPSIFDKIKTFTYRVVDRFEK